MPDDRLLQAAQDRTVRTELSDHVERLLSDPRAAHRTADLARVWLKLDQLQTISREGLTDDLRDTLYEQTDDFVVDHASEPLSAMMRDGLLELRSVLTTHALPDSSSPVHRGLLVREHLVCEPLPPPPINLDTSPPEVDPTLSTRDRYAEHSDNPACASCHERIDPLGFAFEHYDELGQWRDLDAGHPIDATGDLDGVAFDGVDGLTEVLLADDRFEACYLQTWRRHLTGLSACADPVAGLLVDEPLREHTERAHFVSRTGTGGDTLAQGARVDLTPLPADDRIYGTGIDTTVRIDDWMDGWCADIDVRNTSPLGAVEWEVQLEVDGTIDTLWSAVVVEEDGVWTFTGESWNRTLQPGSMTNFGFCAYR